jgi:hypothetical protein
VAATYEGLAGKYAKAEMPSEKIAKDLASGGGCEAIVDIDRLMDARLGDSLVEECLEGTKV